MAVYDVNMAIFVRFQSFSVRFRSFSVRLYINDYQSVALVFHALYNNNLHALV
nr:MAG TPA: hypothetical protein [Caudoviricetes sp.]